MKKSAVGLRGGRAAQAGVLAAFALVLSIASAQAQVARVAGVQHVAEKRAGGGGWQSAKVGVGLGAGDGFRTGKRSKADLKFGNNGSLLRLGQLSSVEIRTDRSVQLTAGQMLYAAMGGKQQNILAGAATAAIKGSAAFITANADGSSEFTLYIGTMLVQTPRETVNVPPGFWIESKPDGTLSALRFATPFGFASTATPQGAVGGSTAASSDLTSPPQDVPFIGSDFDTRMRTTPDRVALDQQTRIAMTNSNPQINAANPIIIANGRDNNPFPIPFPTPPQPVPTAFPTLPPNNAVALREVAQKAAPSLSHAPRDSAMQRGPILLAQALPAGTNLPVGTGMQGDVLEEIHNLDISGALNHIDETDRSLGGVSGGDISLVAAIADGGSYAYGARLHTFSTKGRWFLDLAALPLRVHFNQPNGNVISGNYSAVNSAFVTYRSDQGDLQIGRQKFLGGPAQATLFGSMVRSGGREVMDAVRISPDLGRSRRLEVAYIHDAFVKNLPYRFDVDQQGWYGRYAVQSRRANIGVNLLKYTKTTVPNTTGLTVDVAIPLIRNKLEAYGEFGRDPFRRDLTTVGLSFPFLHDRTDLDVYLEYANLKASGTAPRPPTELTLRAYRPIGENANFVVAVSRFYGTDTTVTFGVTFGAKTVTHHGGD